MASTVPPPGRSAHGSPYPSSELSSSTSIDPAVLSFLQYIACNNIIHFLRCANPISNDRLLPSSRLISEGASGAGTPLPISSSSMFPPSAFKNDREIFELVLDSYIPGLSSTLTAPGPLSGPTHYCRDRAINGSELANTLRLFRIAICLAKLTEAMDSDETVNSRFQFKESEEKYRQVIRLFSNFFLPEKTIDDSCCEDITRQKTRKLARRVYLDLKTFSILLHGLDVSTVLDDYDGIDDRELMVESAVRKQELNRSVKGELLRLYDLRNVVLSVQEWLLWEVSDCDGFGMERLHEVMRKVVEEGGDCDVIRSRATSLSSRPKRGRRRFSAADEGDCCSLFTEPHRHSPGPGPFHAHSHQHQTYHHPPRHKRQRFGAAGSLAESDLVDHGLKAITMPCLCRDMAPSGGDIVKRLLNHNRADKGRRRRRSPTSPEYHIKADESERQTPKGPTLHPGTIRGPDLDRNTVDSARGHRLEQSPLTCSSPSMGMTTSHTLPPPLCSHNAHLQESTSLPSITSVALYQPRQQRDAPRFPPPPPELPEEGRTIPGYENMSSLVATQIPQCAKDPDAQDPGPASLLPVDRTLVRCAKPPSAEARSEGRGDTEPERLDLSPRQSSPPTSPYDVAPLTRSWPHSSNQDHMYHQSLPLPGPRNHSRGASWTSVSLAAPLPSPTTPPRLSVSHKRRGSSSSATSRTFSYRSGRCHAVDVEQVGSLPRLRSDVWNSGGTCPATAPNGSSEPTPRKTSESTPLSFADSGVSFSRRDSRDAGCWSPWGTPHGVAPSPTSVLRPGLADNPPSSPEGRRRRGSRNALEHSAVRNGSHLQQSTDAMAAPNEAGVAPGADCSLVSKTHGFSTVCSPTRPEGQGGATGDSSKSPSGKAPSDWLPAAAVSRVAVAPALASTPAPSSTCTPHRAIPVPDLPFSPSSSVPLSRPRLPRLKVRAAQSPPGFEARDVAGAHSCHAYYFPYSKSTTHRRKPNPFMTDADGRAGPPTVLWGKRQDQSPTYQAPGPAPRERSSSLESEGRQTAHRAHLGAGSHRGPVAHSIPRTNPIMTLHPTSPDMFLQDASVPTMASRDIVRGVSPSTGERPEGPFHKLDYRIVPSIEVSKAKAGRSPPAICKSSLNPNTASRTPPTESDNEANSSRALSASGEGSSSMLQTPDGGTRNLPANPNAPNASGRVSKYENLSGRQFYGRRALKRQPWTAVEEAALEDGLEKFRTNWVHILATYHDTFHPKRSPMDLKDKARNIRRKRERRKLDLGPFQYAVK